MKLWVAVAFAIIGSLLAAGLLFLTIQRPRGEPVALRPPPTSAPIVVYVAGAVANPGLYSLSVGSRINDAVQAAGGFTPKASADGVNLAAPLEDGERVIIPALGEAQVPQQQSELHPLEPTNQVVLMIVNINTASQAELESLPEIGPKTAQAIIAYRTANGPFKSIQAIQEVDGIGPTIFERIKDWITIDAIP